MNKFQIVSEVISKVDDAEYLQRMNMKLGKEKMRMANRIAKISNPKDIPYMNIQAHNLQKKHDYVKQLLKQKHQAIKDLRRKS